MSHPLVRRRCADAALEICRHNLIDRKARPKACRRLVLLSDVDAQRLLGALKIMFNTACALAIRSVSDDPNCALAGLTFAPSLLACALLEHESGREETAHDFNISAMADSVTRILPATRLVCKRPLLISVRREVTVSWPPGKKRATACFSV